MPQETKSDNRQRQKRKMILSIFISFFALAVLAQLRFVPALNDAISRQPQYMQYIAVGVAQALGVKLHSPAPIFVAADERESCKSLKGVQSYDRSRLYYVITYSEKSNSYCLAVYAAAIAGSPPEQVITLLPSTGKNYGAPLTEAVKVVPVGHSSETYASAHLFSLLHWRAQPEKYIATLPQGIQAATTAVALPTGETVPVNLPELRPEIAKSHDLTNLVLLNGLCLTGVLLIALQARLWVAHKQFARECLLYGQDIGWWEFLLRDLNRVFAEVQELYYRKQGESRQQTRAQAILRRSRDEVTSKLEGLLLSSLPGSEKDRIRKALENEDLEEMKSLLRELQALQPHGPPELRLQELLESLKDFCSADELIVYQQQAFQIFREKSFREAREFVVKTHEELRMRARKAKEDEEQKNAS